LRVFFGLAPHTRTRAVVGSVHVVADVEPVAALAPGGERVVGERVEWVTDGWAVQP
jgi:hypothetical protein